MMITDRSTDKASEIEQVVCEVCLKEVPASESTGEEVVDYVAHYCGLECYEKWKQLSDKQDGQALDG